VTPYFINSTAGDLSPQVTAGGRYLYLTNVCGSGTTIARPTRGGVVDWDVISGLTAVGDLVAATG
jgi:hypothetical protein